MGCWCGYLYEVQTCIWPSRCHCHSLSLAPVNPDWSYLPGFTSLVPAHMGGPGRVPEEQWSGCVCVYVCTVGGAFRGNGSVAVQRNMIFLNLYEFQSFEANRLMKEYITKGRTKTTKNDFWNIWNNNYCSVWVWSSLAYSRQLLMRRMETSLGLCPCKGTPFWTFVIIMDAKCSLLTLSRWKFMTVVVSCYRNARVRFLDIQCKISAVAFT